MTRPPRSIQGEAIFLRAHYHFEAWRMWGNVPYYREDDTTFKKPNLQADAVVTEILKDLDEAIGLLPTSPRNGQIRASRRSGQPRLTRAAFRCMPASSPTP